MEPVLVWISVVTSWKIWGKWYLSIFSVTKLASPLPHRFLLLITPIICAGILYGTLRILASHDVRNNVLYLTFYLLMGATWVGIAVEAFLFCGLSVRDDAIERQNAAVSYGISGALIGITLCFAGGNIGDGPGWWVVAYSAMLSTGAWFLLWLVLEYFTQISEAIAIDRDRASGLRLAGFLVASGAILGRAVAGNWESFDATTIDFVRYGWPVIILAIAAIKVEKVCQPTAKQPSLPITSHGLIPLFSYISSSIIYILVWGGLR
ncbi:MAG: hypothetical protein RMZ41_007505 [Nostoc sp. DedVER02]|uniref:hypothetical protein n=1 Tax=unclassified Nostoc TaxID=2593658 RepID=UPI002AD3CDB7|nr:MULTISPECIES: hypothetical protein [unclassified Nostoc]MDZ7985450.1 hypothetical protein [Nostoc sp. DedVER02]MDZ8116916.1 hypothetical protein [Nostoc sp. DedVER01b]